MRLFPCCFWYILGSVQIEWKANVRFVVPVVRPSTYIMVATIESVFLKIWHWGLLSLSIHQFHIWLKSDNNVGQFASRFEFLYIVDNRNNVLYHKNNDKEIHSCLFLAKLKDFNSSLFSVTHRILVAGLPMSRDELSLPSSSPLRLDQYVFTQTSVIDCQSSLQNTSEERIIHLRSGRNLKSFGYFI